MVPVLMYHAVGKCRDSRFERWVISANLLFAHLEIMRSSGFRVVGLRQYLNLKQRSNCVILTFDDGYADFADFALPQLIETDSTATVYAVTGYVGRQAGWLPFRGEKDRRMMKWDELRAIEAKGIEVGGHSETHRELDILPLVEARAEIAGCRAALIDEGIDASSFCYPFGYATSRLRNIVEQVGFSSACVVGRGMADFDGDLLRLRRLEVHGRVSPEALLDRIRGPELKLGDRLRESCSPAWRAVRRVRRTEKAWVKI